MSLYSFIYSTFLYVQTLFDVLLHPVIFKLLLSNLPITFIFEFIDILGFLFVFLTLNNLLSILRNLLFSVYNRYYFQQTANQSALSTLFAFEKFNYELSQTLLKY